MDVQGEMLAKTGKIRGNKDPRLKEATVSGKRRTDLQDPQNDSRAGIHETSKWDVQGVTKNDEPDIVEGTAPSETEKETAHRAGAGNVEAPATRDGLNPPPERKNFG
jgi:hypothetical protein